MRWERWCRSSEDRDKRNWEEICAKSPPWWQTTYESVCCRTNSEISNALYASHYKDLIEVIQGIKVKQTDCLMRDYCCSLVWMAREVLSELRESLQLDWTQPQVACLNVIRALWTLAGQGGPFTYVTYQCGRHTGTGLFLRTGAAGAGGFCQIIRDNEMTSMVIYYLEVVYFCSTGINYSVKIAINDHEWETIITGDTAGHFIVCVAGWHWLNKPNVPNIEGPSYFY